MSDARKKWLGYLRGYPSRVEGAYRDELKRLSSAPETADWFAKNMPQADAEMRTTRIQQAAAQNAKRIAGQEFAKARQEHGVKAFRRGDLERDLEAEHGAFVPDVKTAAEAGPDAADRYKTRVLPDLVRGDMDRLAPYLDFDPDDAPDAAKPQPKPANAPASRPAQPMKAMPAEDPVLALLYRRMGDNRG